jgi:chromosome segregation ATPase
MYGLSKINTMARWNDNAPVGNTCPKIDDVISLVDNLKGYDINNEIEFSDMEIDVKSVNNIMENIRSDNSELREWGNELHREKTDLENTVYQLKQRVSELERENSNYYDEIKDLEEQISELESQNVV